MTESIRRSGEYEYPQGDGQDPFAYRQQHASTPVDPEWPPPPAYPPAQPPATAPTAAYGHGGHGGGGFDGGGFDGGGHDGGGYDGGGYDGGGHGGGGHDGGGYDGGTALLPGAPVGGAAPAARKRAKGPLALLAAVAIAAAAVGGGPPVPRQAQNGQKKAGPTKAGTPLVAP
ncbi:hypothetical protein ABZ651_24210, partial [Streptomyces sp. NPDC007070]